MKHNQALRDRARIEDILRACAEAEDLAAQGVRDRKTILALCYTVLIIGEAANNLSEEAKAQYPTIPWPGIVGMRHRLVHDYGRVNETILWEVVQSYIPVLRNVLQSAR